MGSTSTKSFNGLLYGKSGSAKTHTALEIAETITPEGKSILHVDTSANKDVREYVAKRHPYAPLPFTTIEDLRLVTAAMLEGYGPFGSVGCVILDEASQMFDEDLDRVYETRKHLIETGERRTPKEGIPDTPDWADYRPALQRFRSMLSNLYNIPGMHVILVAHERLDDKVGLLVPDFIPAVRKVIVKPLHLMARLTADVVTPLGSEQAVYARVTQIHPSKQVDAKSRLGVPEVTFGTEHLPPVVKGWLDRGAPEIEAPDVPIVEPVYAPAKEEPTEPDIMTDDDTLDAFNPIN